MCVCVCDGTEVHGKVPIQTGLIGASLLPDTSRIITSVLNYFTALLSLACHRAWVDVNGLLIQKCVNLKKKKKT